MTTMVTMAGLPRVQLTRENFYRELERLVCRTALRHEN
jgi:hypothetical protein